MPKQCCCQICTCHPSVHKCLPPLPVNNETKFYGTTTNKDTYKAWDLTAKPPKLCSRKSNGAFLRPEPKFYDSTTTKVK